MMVLKKNRIKNKLKSTIISESKDFFHCQKNKSLIIIKGNIETMILEGSENIILIEGKIVTMVIEGNKNKIIINLTFGIKNIIFRGNKNIVKSKNILDMFNIIDNGYYNFVFRKKNVNKELVLNLNLKNLNFLSNKRKIQININI